MSGCYVLFHNPTSNLVSEGTLTHCLEAIDPEYYSEYGLGYIYDDDGLEFEFIATGEALSRWLAS